MLLQKHINMKICSFPNHLLFIDHEVLAHLTTTEITLTTLALKWIFAIVQCLFTLGTTVQNKGRQTNAALVSNEVTSESIWRAWQSSSLQSPRLAKFLQQEWLIAPYQAGNKRNLLRDTSKPASSHLLVFLGIMAFFH